MGAAKKKTKEDSTRGAAVKKKNISFKGCQETVEQVFGKKNISRADVLKLISAYIKEKDLVDKSI